MSDETTATDRTDDEPQPIDAELRTPLSRAFDFDDPPETLGAFWERMLRTFADALGRQVTLADLCTTDESPHRALAGDTTHHYRCVTDALLFGTVSDRETTVRTVSTVSGTELVVEFDESGVRSAPEGAWLSFGVERSVSPPDGSPTPEAMYGRLCPYSKAFASREEYEGWDAARPDVVSAASPLKDVLATLSRLLSDVDPAADEADRSTASATAAACTCCTGGDRL